MYIRNMALCKCRSTMKTVFPDGQRFFVSRLSSHRLIAPRKNSNVYLRDSHTLLPSATFLPKKQATQKTQYKHHHKDVLRCKKISVLVSCPSSDIKKGSHLFRANCEKELVNSFFRLSTLETRRLTRQGKRLRFLWFFVKTTSAPLSATLGPRHPARGRSARTAGTDTGPCAGD